MGNAKTPTQADENKNVQIICPKQNQSISFLCIYLFSSCQRLVRSLNKLSWAHVICCILLLPLWYSLLWCKDWEFVIIYIYIHMYMESYYKKSIYSCSAYSVQYISMNKNFSSVPLISHSAAICLLLYTHTYKINIPRCVKTFTLM